MLKIALNGVPHGANHGPLTVFLFRRETLLLVNENDKIMEYDLKSLVIFKLVQKLLLFALVSKTLIIPLVFFLYYAIHSF